MMNSMARFSDVYPKGVRTPLQNAGNGWYRDAFEEQAYELEDEKERYAELARQEEWQEYLVEARRDGFRTTTDSAEEQRRGDFDVDYLPFLDAPLDASPFIKGWVHLFAGNPYSGKTEALVRLAYQWATGPRPLRVIYFHEELPQLFLNRITRLGFQSDYFLHIDCINWGHEMFLDRMEWIKGDVVILDSTKSMQLESTDDKGVSNFMQEFGWYVRYKDMSSVLSHHLNKSGAAGGGSIYGAHAWRAMADTVIEMTGVERRDNNRREITAHRRLVPFAPLITELIGTNLSVIGSPNDLTAEGIKERVLNVLDKPLTTKELMDAIGKPAVTDKTLTKYLGELAEVGRIKRDPDIAKGSVSGATYRWIPPIDVNHGTN